MSLPFQRSNGHPEPEVIVNVGDNIHLIHRLNLPLQYADGYAYSKSKFEDGLRIVLAEKPSKPAKIHSAIKKEDIDLIVRRFEQVDWPLIMTLKGLRAGNTAGTSREGPLGE
jgi:hypothetical protein